MLKELLENWLKTYQILDRFKRDLEQTVTNYRIEEPIEYAEVFRDKGVQDIDIRMLKMTYEESFRDTQPYISVVADLWFEGAYVGWFKQVFTLSSEVVDDYFVIESE